MSNERCSGCKMGLVHRDQHFGPPEFCEKCWGFEMEDEYEPYISIIAVWANETEKEQSKITAIRRNNPHIADGAHEIYVDKCISEYVQHMNDLGIITIGCCCGHGQTEPSVLVALESMAIMVAHQYDYADYEGNLIHYIQEDTIS